MTAVDLHSVRCLFSVQSWWALKKVMEVTPIMKHDTIALWKHIGPFLNTLIEPSFTWSEFQHFVLNIVLKPWDFPDLNYVSLLHISLARSSNILKSGIFKGFQTKVKREETAFKYSTETQYWLRKLTWFHLPLNY